jgi:hypothetical protein
MVILTCKPRFSGGSDQEDHSLRPAQAKSYQDPHLNKPTGCDGQVCDLSYVGG